MRAEQKKEASTFLPMFLCWFAYTVAYLGRYSYASNITAIMDAYGVNHSEAGLVTTFFFFAYGVGQIVNGILCKHYNKRKIIAVALCCSAILNLAIFFGAPFASVKYLWLLNGAAQSILWSTLIGILSETLQAEDLKKAVVVMSTTVPIGTFAAYGFSSLMAVFNRYDFSFLFGAVTMLVAAVIWFILYPKAFSGKTTRQRECLSPKTKTKKDFSLIALVTILGILAMANNLIKDGLTTWIPSILKEKFLLPESLSILLTLVLPILGLFGAACNTILQKKVSSFIAMAGIWYFATAICIGIGMLFLDTALWQVILLAFGLISLFMHGVNNLITSMAPLYMRERIHSGLLAGVLNGCCYVGSTISSYGLGSVADRFGWEGVFRLLLAVGICAVLICAAAEIAGRKKKKKA